MNQPLDSDYVDCEAVRHQPDEGDGHLENVTLTGRGDGGTQRDIQR